MNSTNGTTRTIHITREHDKICLLEKIISNIGTHINANIEKYVSQYIDSCIHKNDSLSKYYLKLLHTEITDDKSLNSILNLSTSIIHQTPYVLNIEANEDNKSIITYFSMQQILPLI